MGVWFNFSFWMPRTTSPFQRKTPARFFEDIASEPLLRSLIENLPGASFVIKDREGRYIAASEGAYRRYGATSEAQLLGRTDYDFIDAKLADHYVGMDRAVMESGKSKVGVVEIGFDAHQVPDWLWTQKFPVFNRAGKVIGVLVLIQSYEGQKAALATHESVRQAIAYMETHQERQIPVPEIARRVGLSERQLQRQFGTAFGMSVQEFAVYHRIQAAARALRNSDASVAQIATSVGFSDQSAFTRRFRATFGITPSAYRQKP